LGITRLYQTYYGVHLHHWTENWGGNAYNKFLVKDYLDADVYSEPTSDGASAITFLNYGLYKNVYYLDGVAEGHFRLYNNHASDTTELTSFTVTIQKIDDAGTTTDLAAHTETLSSPSSITAGQFVACPIRLNIEKAKIEASEKLLLKLEFSAGQNDKLIFYHDNSSTDEDVKIKLPYAPVGG